MAEKNKVFKEGKSSLDKMEKIISLCKRRGFVFQGSEIYGGLAGAYDFGPMGVELLNNIKDFWWKEMVHKKSDYYGLDSAMFKHPKVWEASGHIAGFSDPMAECKNCNTRIRVDKELEKIGMTADEKMSEEEINKLFFKNLDKIKCPKCGKTDFTPAKNFNLLIKSNYGDFTDKNTEPVYLPGEACQGIYLNYKNVVDSMHPKIPFGIAQINKAFRNEISPRNFLFRCREFEQADSQYFVRPNENKEKYEEIKKERWQWYLDLGLSEKNLRWKRHDNLVFYAKDAWDIEYNYPTYGFDELEGIHDRSDYDLTQHSKFSGVDLFFNEDGNKFIPWILETSVGLGRIFLAVLSEAYTVEMVDGEERTILKFSKQLAPVKVAFLPLSKKEELTRPTINLFKQMKNKFICQYDETQSIGKRYRRQDEIGTPYCVTFDFESLNDGAVTVRERDTMRQDRVKINNLENYLSEKLIE